MMKPNAITRFLNKTCLIKGTYRINYMVYYDIGAFIFFNEDCFTEEEKSKKIKEVVCALHKKGLKCEERYGGLVILKESMVIKRETIGVRYSISSSNINISGVKYFKGKTRNRKSIKFCKRLHQIKHDLHCRQHGKYVPVSGLTKKRKDSGIQKFASPRKLTKIGMDMTYDPVKLSVNIFHLEEKDYV